jgi:F-type H+-transporting ATPase subunit g
LTAFPRLTPRPNSSVATFQAFYQNAWNSLRTGSLFQSPQAILNSIRNVSTAQLAAGGVIAAELLGFFTVGEIIGRFKLVGYRGEVASHH